MAKKGGKKKKAHSTKKSSKKKASKKQTVKIPKDDAKLGKILIENFVGLQKVMVNLSTKFDELSSKINKLLDLFEISAKALAEKDLTVEKTSRDDKKILQEVNNLSEQNKVIAKGLTLMHNRLSGETEEPMEEPPQRPPAPMLRKNPPKRQPPMKRPSPERGKKVMPAKDSQAGYQKSITSEPTSKQPPQ